MQRSRIWELLEAVQDQMLIDFERRSTQIPHMGERGIAREDVVRGFLRDHLPGRFGVSNGFVIDAAGGVSAQMDCIIYDKFAAPVFPVSDTQHLVPIECVAGVVSIKSKLTAEELREAHENVLSAVRLDRFAGGRQNMMYGGTPGPFEHVGHEFAEPIFGAIFAFDSPSLESVAMNLHSLNASLEPRHRLGLVGVLGKGVLSQVNGEGLFQPTYEEDARVALCEDPKAALLLYYAILANQVTRRIAVYVSFLRYLGIKHMRLRVVGPNGTIDD